MKPIISKQKKVAVGLSGGVDSAVAAYLLKKEGYDVTGVYLQCWDRKADGCDSDKDKIFAIRNAKHLDIPFIHLDFIKEYKERVIEYFYSEYKAGRTPNPDVMCNKEIKFGMFFDWAVKEEFDYVATGHYARTSRNGNQSLLLKGVDESKDQSYFLYLLGQEQLAKTLFPVGGLLKKEVRKLAEENGLPASKRPDSMGICFIGEVDINKFLRERIAPKKGSVLSLDGDIIGEHEGVWFYTIGQRHGFKIGKYTGKPLYVVRKNIEENEIVVGTETDALVNEFKVSSLHWVSGSEPRLPRECNVRIRHLGELYPCTVSVISEGVLEVNSKKNIFGVSPGQSAVFYEGDAVLGGGVIV